MKRKDSNCKYFAVILDGLEGRGQTGDPVLFSSIIDAVEDTMNSARYIENTGHIAVYRCTDTAERYCTFRWKIQRPVSVDGINYSDSWVQFIRTDAGAECTSVQPGEHISRHGRLLAFSTVIATS